MVVRKEGGGVKLSQIIVIYFLDGPAAAATRTSWILRSPTEWRVAYPAAGAYGRIITGFWKLFRVYS